MKQEISTARQKKSDFKGKNTMLTETVVVNAKDFFR